MSKHRDVEQSGRITLEVTLPKSVAKWLSETAGDTKGASRPILIERLSYDAVIREWADPPTNPPDRDTTTIKARLPLSLAQALATQAKRNYETRSLESWLSLLVSYAVFELDDETIRDVLGLTGPPKPRPRPPTRPS